MCFKPHCFEYFHSSISSVIQILKKNRKENKDIKASPVNKTFKFLQNSTTQKCSHKKIKKPYPIYKKKIVLLWNGNSKPSPAFVWRIKCFPWDRSSWGGRERCKICTGVLCSQPLKLDIMSTGNVGRGNERRGNDDGITCEGWVREERREHPWSSALRPVHRDLCPWCQIVTSRLREEDSAFIPKGFLHRHDYESYLSASVITCWWFSLNFCLRCEAAT